MARNSPQHELKIQMFSPIFTALAVLLAASHGIDGVAWAITATATFNGCFMLLIVLRGLGVRWRDMLVSMSPALILNTMLTTPILIFDLAAQAIWIAHDLMRLAITTIVNGVVYGICVLHKPISGLATVRGHWKERPGLDRFTCR